MNHIQSAKNPKIKEWKKLLTKKERDQTGTFLVEGFHLVEEALAGDRIIEMIIIESKDMPPGWNYGDIPVTMVTDEIIGMLADTETPQGILAVCEQDHSSVDIEGRRYLLIDAVQDPGNLGTMIRTADAAGLDAVIVGEGSVDVYNPKVLRSAQGSHFHLPVIKGNLFDWVNRLKENHVPVYGTALEGASEYTGHGQLDSFALLVGNEGRGVNKELLTQTTANLYIPILGKSESLNVAVAAGILLYHFRK
ncbi:TrmH family RNA methyltransferase [Cytobacillus sp. NCCP-133]|uniref:TrmH family RNA methyltransferase n=1 Tax=Cytobacillus sp. NCCP-133 TaxID=766848 RepID=UPI0022309980|nr:RNA methyltransferase [Cytobacillus sp. NCCP-133]GLB58443.1 23S rRNA methyltransferase [Cytobacillus sp. NCCP-133]